MTRGAAEPKEPMTTRVSTIGVQLESIVAQQHQMGLDLRACAKNVEDLRIDVLQSRRIDPWKLTTAIFGVLGTAITLSTVIGTLVAACIWYRIQIGETRTSVEIEALKHRLDAEEANSTSAARRSTTPTKPTTKGSTP